MLAGLLGGLQVGPKRLGILVEGLVHHFGIGARFVVGIWALHTADRARQRPGISLADAVVSLALIE